jgi:RND superfamily putative drug exporter
LSLPITLLILIVAFGALVAAGIPVLLAITGVGATLALVALVSHLAPVDPAVSEVVLLIGMADGMVLVLPWRAMSHRRVVEAMQRLVNFDCPLIGVVLSRIGGRAHPDYEYVGYTQTKA